MLAVGQLGASGGLRNDLEANWWIVSRQPGYSAKEGRS